MKKGEIIVIEGTDCSGKETQTKLLAKKLIEKGFQVWTESFPRYDSPTGKIVGGPLFGKSSICNGWFPETAPNVDPYVSSLYLAADRRYHKEELLEHLHNGEIILLDRYVSSNLGHQGSKFETKEERFKYYENLEYLEYQILGLPKPNATFFLYMPFEYGELLRKERNKKESLDQAELNSEHLKKSEKTYLELCERNEFYKINCVKDGHVRSIEDINEELLQTVEKIIKS